MSRQVISIAHLGSAAQRQVVEQIGEQERVKAKYRNERTQLDGLWFASKKEAKRYAELAQLLRAGLISKLILQERFVILVNDIKICTYVADFSYVEDGIRVVEDVKGIRTSVYNLKKKLMKAVFGVEISEI